MNSFKITDKELKYWTEPNVVWGVALFSDPSLVTVYTDFKKVIVQLLDNLFKRHPLKS